MSRIGQGRRVVGWPWELLLERNPILSRGVGACGLLILIERELDVFSYNRVELELGVSVDAELFIAVYVSTRMESHSVVYTQLERQIQSHAVNIPSHS